jgi:hypothetical protein
MSLKACRKRHGVTTLAAVPPLWVQLAELDWPEPKPARQIAAADQQRRGADASIWCVPLRALFPAGAAVRRCMG